MSFQGVSSAGLSFGESLWGESFTVAGVSYTGTVADVRGEGRVILVGSEDVADLIVVASRSQFASAPKAVPSVVLGARGLTWRIVNVNADELSYTLTCKLR